MSWLLFDANYLGNSTKFLFVTKVSSCCSGKEGALLTNVAQTLTNYKNTMCIFVNWGIKKRLTNDVRKHLS